MSVQKKESVLVLINKLDKWFTVNGLSGYDPYDVKSHPLIIRITKRSAHSKFFTYLREFLFEFFLLFPHLSRRLLNIKKSVNPKAIALFASGYLNLYKIEGEKKYLDKCRNLLLWLIENKVTVNNGIGWGYPFDWQSTEFIPANTPNGIVTTTVAEAFWRYYKYSNDTLYLEYCKQISVFLNSLPTYNIEGKGICFSYTPLFVNHVHNLNLFVAEFLLKIGIETGNKAYIGRAMQAIDYTISDQKSDGSFDYNGPPEKPNHFIDNYHTGFVMRMLLSVWHLTNDNNVYSALNMAYSFYLSSFFEDNKIPKFTPSSKYRIDIHSCSESLICLSELHMIFGKGKDIAENVLKWTVNHLMNSQRNIFYHGIFKSKISGIPFKSKIGYIRWGQAWMFKALTEYYLNTYVK